jgi:hypothetical protein
MGAKIIDRLSDDLTKAFPDMRGFRARNLKYMRAFAEAYPDKELGIRQGELGALRWLECDFDNMSISVQHSYYWRRGGNLKSTKTEASAKLLPMPPSLKHSLQEWRSQSLYNKPEDFVFPSERLQGIKPLDLASVLKKKIQPAFRRIGITVWVAHVLAFGGNHAGGDGRTSAHNSGLLAAQQPSCHEQVPAGDIEDQTLGTGQIGRRYFADGYLAEDKPNPMSAVWNRSRMGPFSFGAYRPLTSPNLLDVRVASAWNEWRGRRDSNPRPLP